MDSIFHITTDLPCRVLHFGAEICTASPGEDTSIFLKKGRHKLTFISTDNSQDQYSIIYSVIENDVEDFIDIELKPYLEARLQKEAQDERIAFEKKQAELIALELKREKELEIERENARLLRAEQERLKAAAEAERLRTAEEERVWEEREDRFSRFILSRDNYNAYTIRTIPSYANNISFLAPYTVYNPKPKIPSHLQLSDFKTYVPHKRVGESSLVFPVVKRIKSTIRFELSDIIEYFAKISYNTIKRTVFGDHDSTDLILRHASVQVILDSMHKYYKDQSQKWGITLRDELNNNHGYSSFCQCYYDSLHNMNGVLNLFKTQERNAILDFFYYMAATDSSWKDFSFKMAQGDSSYYLEPNYIRAMKELINSTHSRKSFSCECCEYRVVYIDEACNQVFDATDYDIVTAVDKGIMILGKQISGKDNQMAYGHLMGKNNIFLFSVRNYEGNELFSVENSIDKYYDHLPVFSDSLDVSDDGRISSVYLKTGYSRRDNFEFCYSYWVSGSYSIDPDWRNSIGYFSHQVVQLNRHLPLSYYPRIVRCWTMNNKYYVPSYQGPIEIQKPDDWDARFERLLPYGQQR